MARLCQCLQVQVVLLMRPHNVRLRRGGEARWPPQLLLAAASLVSSRTAGHGGTFGTMPVELYNGTRKVWCTRVQMQHRASPAVCHAHGVPGADNTFDAKLQYCGPAVASWRTLVEGHLHPWQDADEKAFNRYCSNTIASIPIS